MMKWKVNIIETERGWGCRVDEVKEFESEEEAKKFVTDFNRPNHEEYARTRIVPDWYMYADLPYQSAH